MKFSCKKEKLEKSLACADRFTGKHITLPILTHILCEVVDHTLRIVATNLEHALEIFIPVTGAKNGKVSVPSRILHSFLQSVGEENIEAEEKQGCLLLKTSSKNIKINGISATEFPLIPKIKKQHSFSISSRTLAEGLTRVLPAVSISEFKPELTGVFFQASPTSLRLAATDTFRLAEQTIAFGQKLSESFSFILPARVSQELVRVFGEEECVMTVAVGENQALCEGGGMRITSRLIDGKFPEYAAIVPKHFQTTVHCERNDLLQNIRTSSIFASKLQDVTMAFGAHELHIQSSNAEVGEYKTVLPAALSGNNALGVSFNYHYLMDGLHALSEDTIFLGLNDGNSPVLFRNKDDGSFLYVLMPIRASA